jgi:hypothetical protein
MIFSGHPWDRFFRLAQEPYQPSYVLGRCRQDELLFDVSQATQATFRSLIWLRSSEKSASILFRARRAVAYSGVWLSFRTCSRTSSYQLTLSVRRVADGVHAGLWEQFLHWDGDAGGLQSKTFLSSFQHLSGRNDFLAEACWGCGNACDDAALTVD